MSKKSEIVEKLSLLKEQITFDGGKHRYKFVGVEHDLCSVTQLLKLYKPHFDAEAAARQVAKRRNVTVESVLADWKQQGYISTVLGTLLHRYIEHSFEHTSEEWRQSYRQLCEDRISTVPRDSQEILAQKHLKNIQLFDVFRASERCKGLELVGHEVPVINKPTKSVCGTIDMICVDEDANLKIVDFKTNKKIEATSPYRNRYTPPVSHLVSCELVDYSLQLNLYKYILETQIEPLKVSALELWWINSEANDEVQVFEIQDYQKEVKALVDDYQCQLLFGTV